VDGNYIVHSEAVKVSHDAWHAPSSVELGEPVLGLSIVSAKQLGWTYARCQHG
jgi:hypothetical protein